MDLIWILLLPLLAAFISALPLRRWIGPLTTVISSVAGFVLSIRVALFVSQDHSYTFIHAWVSCDAFSAITLVLISFISLMVAIFSWGYMGHVIPADSPKKSRLYFVGYNLSVLSILAVPIVSQMAMAWIAVALTTLLSAFLVSFDSTPQALEAAWKYVVLTSLGAVMALFGVFLLYWAANSAGISEFSFEALAKGAPSMSPAVTTTAFLFILVGLGTKIGLVPLHTWLPDTYGEAPIGICALLSGAEASAVLYFMLRLVPVALSANYDMGSWLVFFGLLSAGVAVLLLLQARDIKRMFAFSTIEHMGIIMLAVGLGHTEADFGALYQIIAHALTKSFCFLAAGLVVMNTGSRKLDDIRGVIRSSPVAGAALLVGGLAISGIPPFAVFTGELSIVKAGLSTQHYLVIALLAVFMAVGFYAVMTRVNRMVFGDPKTVTETKLPASAVLSLILTAVPMVALGLYLPSHLEHLLQGSARVLGGY